ncbi:suppressor of disruption of TFIIS-like [Cucumis melo var. makuwa]|uniref:Suppressor of disruption of TFIIS-like n=1 Tax=Cucumis melo var. makuwa TaxID=1194695 RepID=A0A5D3DIP0_CUCMM|nr:suppressor of disruption of TFIIS-like [Cucumis melo var. makuwa]
MQDLDDTLYPLSSGLATACKNNIHAYIAEKLGVETSKIPELSNLLYKNYGTTMAGLRAIGYDFDYDEYHRFVHGRLPYDNLKPDPILRNLLLTLPYRKLIFTNADKDHTAKVLNKLGLEDCFEGIICFETLNPPQKSSVLDEKEHIPSSEIFDIIAHFSQPNHPLMELPITPIVCKPSEAAIEWALKIANIDPQRTVGTSHRSKGADYAIESIHNIKEAIPELCEVEMKSELNYSANNNNVAVETSVTA